MDPTLEQQRAELAKTLTDLKSGQGDLATKVRTLETLLQKQDAERVAQARNDVPNLPDSELRAYTRTSEVDVKNNPDCFAKGDGKAVRMTGFLRGAIWHPGLIDDEARSPWQRRFQDSVTERNLVRAVLKAKAQAERRGGPIASPAADARVLDVVAEAPPELARIFADSANIGAEWIPDLHLPSLERDVQVQSGVHKLFVERVMPPAGSLIQPFATGSLRVYKGVVPTTDDPPDATKSSIGTSSQTITVDEWVAATQIDRKAEEDAIIATVPELMDELALAFARAKDDVVINGDTTSTHQDAIASWNTRGIWGATGLGTTADHRRLDLGLRALASDISNTVDQNAVQTVAGVRALLKKLNQAFYADPLTAEIVLLVSPEYFMGTMLGFAEVITWDKAGPMASILTGYLNTASKDGRLPGHVGFLHNVPVCVTPFLTADLATTGLYTGSGSTTGMLAVVRKRFEWRVRKGMTVESMVDIKKNVIDLVARGRYRFRTTARSAASETNVAYGFNLTA